MPRCARHALAGRFLAGCPLHSSDSAPETRLRGSDALHAGPGIGAATIMFTVVDSVLLKPLPFPEPGRLVRLEGRSDISRDATQYLTYPDFLDCRRDNRSLDLAGWVYDSATLSEPERRERTAVRDFIQPVFLLACGCSAGARSFPRGQTRRNARGDPGLQLWQRHFAGSRAAVGASLVLDGKRYTIVASRPAASNSMAKATCIHRWGRTPRRTCRIAMHILSGGSAGFVPLRHCPGSGGVRVAGAQPRRTVPATNKGRSFRMQPLRPDVEGVQSTLWLLLGAVTWFWRLPALTWRASCWRAPCRANANWLCGWRWARALAAHPPVPYRKRAARSRGGALASRCGRGHPPVPGAVAGRPAAGQRGRARLAHPGFAVAISL